ncbi:precorrin-3B synthase [Paraburkholderia hospita]|uniref:Precorrin-3B synthase n=1 Tax=Paraburkholderia hospita TaxID=169430 RepID=A0AAN1MLS7_9BURK|nr:precorrin-3B synthase [Paraburkholderia hospita]OUL68420.1 precorrin-3B synthase [Paraburkholderia hospita]OUL95475.1 precorrin-3B synthase [Paraburkholderia hospita]SEH92385.1 precorrin-3B synthase [Paraburkholderia hospita]
MRPSACPGLLRIVPALDGGICRVKLAGGELSATQALAIAGAIDEHASGIVDITNRANLQLRGVKRGHEDALVAALLDAGLGPQNIEHAFADDVRNVMISPATGRDANALFDTTTLAGDLLTLLQSDTRFAALSPKFSLMLDGGERLMMLDHPHDIWFSAMPHPARSVVLFAFGLAGCPPVAAEHESALATVTASDLATFTRALVHTFLDLAAPDDTRMRDLLTAHSIESIIKHAERKSGVQALRDASIERWRREPADASRRLGAHRQNDGQRWHVGAQPALGRINSATLRGLAELARGNERATLRMTPWQSVILTDIDTANLDATLQTLEALGLATTADNPLTRVIACTGSTGCAKSHADTKADALKLAAHVPEHTQVHLSGCPRSCAAAHRAPYTLLAVADGRYDLYQTHDPRDANGFGRCIARGLTIDEAAEVLQASALPPTDEPFDA